MVVTHDLEAIAGITDHLVVLRRGQVAFDDRRPAGYGYDELKDLYHAHAE
jgi:ABC-type hemin transport system ATPase subunit